MTLARIRRHGALLLARIRRHGWLVSVELVFVLESPQHLLCLALPLALKDEQKTAD